MGDVDIRRQQTRRATVEIQARPAAAAGDPGAALVAGQERRQPADVREGRRRGALGESHPPRLADPRLEQHPPAAPLAPDERVRQRRRPERRREREPRRAEAETVSRGARPDPVRAGADPVRVEDPVAARGADDMVAAGDRRQDRVSRMLPPAQPVPRFGVAGRALVPAPRVPHPEPAAGIEDGRLEHRAALPRLRGDQHRLRVRHPDQRQQRERRQHRRTVQP
jgi:hypothetical protein